jgi:tetratricopeptide (TPR) repeat protein
MASRLPAENRIQAVKLFLAALLLVSSAAGQARFERFDRDLARAAQELHISELRAEVSERGHVVWKRGEVPAAACAASASTQEALGQRIRWWYRAKCLTIELPAKRLGLQVSANSKALTEAPRLQDGNILRSPTALAFLTDVAALGDLDRDELVDRSLIALYFGRRDMAAALARQALDKFPKLESSPDVTLLYLFSQLNLPETESSATAVIRAHPSLPTAWFYYGEFLEKNERYREAAACYHQITTHDPPWHNWTVAAAAKKLRSLETVRP